MPPAEILPFAGLAEPVSAASHLLGALVAAACGATLLRRGARAGRLRVASLVVYMAGVLAMFSASGVYHLQGPEHRDHLLLQRIDHAAIWLQIAGTFTPVHVTFFQGLWRWWPLVVVWTGACCGLVLKLAFFDSVAEGPGMALYLGLGWFGTISVLQLVRERGLRVIAPIFYGGVAYTTGVALELTRWPTPLPGLVGPHELFHLAVLAGVALHWSFIHRWAGETLVPPGDAEPGDADPSPVLVTT